ncbi:cytochrome c-type biogenesis protein CcsB [Homoserinimonas aerilata]|uniref:Heme exporter protein C n=1 Tax=Homoserinimonas aerilata TaxID=1162970 RepID=A0A542YH70_9MICO|nr:c-type cytochrome biogenesis protein CcsB [Homoserinimonas aerilata]TQL47416.1 cytochrome c-type biogenesis protein CcsB [Homoserinimonas aerilata]
MTATLDSYSLVAIYSAMAIYVLAFVLFAVDLAKRSANSHVSSDQLGMSEKQLAAASGSVATLERTRVAASVPSYGLERIAFALTVLATVLHVAAVVLRGVAQGFVPWANMFEFSLTSSAIVAVVFVLLQFWQDLRFLGAYIVGGLLITLGVATVNFYVPVKPLPDALDSYWLVIHVFVAASGTALFAIGAALSLLQLLQARRESSGKGIGFLRTLPRAVRLENSAYLVTVVGFVFWTFTLVAGAIWAERAWGRYWGWDTKEVWTFIIWVVYAGYIHARATRGWRGTRSAWLALIGFASVLFNYIVVNQFFKGLHSYSGL